MKMSPGSFDIGFDIEKSAAQMTKLSDVRQTIQKIHWDEIPHAISLFTYSQFHSP